MVNLTQLCPPLEEDSLVQELVAQYLAQEGYVETARAFTSQLNVDYTIIADADAATRWPVGGLEDPHIANRQRTYLLLHASHGLSTSE